MNKPAPKEPSMDEILSSIRQIIADDDASGLPRRPTTPANPLGGLGQRPVPSFSGEPAAAPVSPLRAEQPVTAPASNDPEPLALTAEQMLPPEDAQPSAAAPAASFDDILGDEEDTDDAPSGALELVDPEDIAFEPDEVEPPAPAAFDWQQTAEPAPAPQAPPPPPRPLANVAQPVPEPQPRTMAEELIEPATQAAVKHTFSKLNGLSMIGSGVTLEAMMRDMLRPMLKEWLDENLPTVVERMVEKEIMRISRGE